MMNLFYDANISGNFHALSLDESRHCIRVLRLRTGDIVHLTDGKGNLFETRIINENDKHCELEVIDVQAQYGKRNFGVHIAVAPTKNISRFEWLLEKATEIGFDSITPLICDHSERKTVNLARLNKVLISAMKQSLKAYLPQLHKPADFNRLIEMNGEMDRFIAYCDSENTVELKNVAQRGRNSLICIGPEGDFSQGEIELALNNHFKPVSLGNSRLRTETAALVTCVTINLINQ
jgi:16S rRNA (uracil1498-N3)-methyltransferase